MPLPSSREEDCPFCTIALAYSASSPQFPSPDEPSLLPPYPSAPTDAEPVAHLLLATPHVLAFLDHQPISRGHVLVATRQHREKVSDTSVEESAAIGTWLGILSRAVVRAARGVSPETTLSHKEEGGEEPDVGDWNIVQNNGARAAQVVPHVHFHIIPRVEAPPEVKARSWTVFGKGQRMDLDDDDAEVLTKAIRRGIQVEIELLRKREGDVVVQELIGEQGRKGRPKL